MKTRTSFSQFGLLCLWATLSALVAFSLLAIAPSRVGIGSPPLSFFTFVTKVEWRGLVLDGESAVAALVVSIAAGLFVFYSLSRSGLVRLGVLVLLLVGPSLAFSDHPREFLGWFVKMPYGAVTGTLHALLGHGNGHFYQDGPFTLAALGWWPLFCLILWFREGALALRKRFGAEQTGCTEPGRSASVAGPPLAPGR